MSLVIRMKIQDAEVTDTSHSKCVKIIVNTREAGMEECVKAWNVNGTNEIVRKDFVFVLLLKHQNDFSYFSTQAGEISVKRIPRKTPEVTHRKELEENEEKTPNNVKLCRMMKWFRINLQWNFVFCIHIMTALAILYNLKKYCFKKSKNL